MTQQYAPLATAATPGTSRGMSAVVPILAGAAVAAVILAVAGFLLWPDGSSDGDATGRPSTVAKASTPSAPTSSGMKDASTDPVTTPSSPLADSPLPAGLVRAKGPGFTIGVPPGWRRSVRGDSVFWTDPASGSYIQVDQTVWSGDPYEHWVEWERQAIADGKLKNFNRISITHTSVAGIPAADIEFTWTRGSGLTRARDRGVIAGGRPYAVVVAVPASRWNENAALVENVLNTFRPSGVG